MSRNRFSSLGERLANASARAQQAFLTEDLKNAKNAMSLAADSYRSAKDTVRKDMVVRAGGLIIALRRLIELCEANGLDGQELEDARAILIEFEIVPIEDRAAKRSKKE